MMFSVGQLLYFWLMGMLIGFGIGYWVRRIEERKGRRK